ncbi:MAG: hypothetical protein EKE20_11100 [Candidatus Symbiopectobacterium sp. Dall1.0]|nr:hypothetical protein [Candidatus Symbiopectobacterium sp. Dall1.0]
MIWSSAHYTLVKLGYAIEIPGSSTSPGQLSVSLREQLNFGLMSVGEHDVEGIFSGEEFV